MNIGLHTERTSTIKDSHCANVLQMGHSGIDFIGRISMKVIIIFIQKICVLVVGMRQNRNFGRKKICFLQMKLICQCFTYCSPTMV